MSYFAELDPDNLVVRVIVCDNLAWIEERLGGTWVETADPYIAPGTVAYTGPGHGYDPDWPLRFAPKWVQPVAILDPEPGQDLWTWYDVGAVTFHGGFLWVSTTPKNVWKPSQAAWRRTPVVPGRPPVWTQPSGSVDTWAKDEHVMRNGVEYVSLTNANVWEPGTNATLWAVVEPAEPTIEAWRPWDGISDKYQLGAEVTHNGLTWTSTHVGQNTWAPGVFGWVASEGDG